MTFVKGKSGNPHGRPRRDQAISEHIRRLLAEVQGDGRTKGEMVAAKLIELTMAGDSRAAVLILERIEGKVPDGTKHDGTVTVRVIRESR